jgi:hypothetical protein
VDSLWSNVVDWLTTGRISVLLTLAFGLPALIFGAWGLRVQLRQHTASERARRESAEPMVMVNIAPSDNDRNAMILTVENIGPSVARNVRIAVDPPPVRSFDESRRRPMHEWSLFKKGISVLPPRARLVYLFDFGSRRFNSELPTEYTFTVDADGPWGPVGTLVYRADLSPMGDVWAGQTTLHTLVDALNKIGNRLQGLEDIAAAIQELSNNSREFGDDEGLTEEAALLQSLTAASVPAGEDGS